MLLGAILNDFPVRFYLAAAPNGSGLQRSRTPCSASLPSVEMSRANPLNQDSCWFQAIDEVSGRACVRRGPVVADAADNEVLHARPKF